MIRVAAYCRVSTGSDDQVSSLKNQKEYFDKVISENPDWVLHEIYADDGISGTILGKKRKEFMRMIRDCGLDDTFQIVGKSKIDFILVKDTSRFARNTSSTAVIKTLAANKVYIKFLDINKSSEDGENDLLFHILSAVDELDSKTRSKRVKFGIQQSAKRNTVKTSRRIFGFDYVPKPEYRLVQNEYSPIVERIFEMYAQGLGARRIAKILLADGLKTPSGAVISESRISQILLNEKYAGLNPILKYDSGVVFRKNPYPIVKDKYDVLPTDKIEAIVSPELFYQCKAIREGKIYHKINKGRNLGKSKYASLLFCGKCGSAYTVNSFKDKNGERVLFYNCRTKKNFSAAQCGNPNILESKIDIAVEKYAAFLNLHKAITLDDFVLAALIKAKYDLVDKLDTSGADEVARLESKKESLEQQLTTYIRMLPTLANENAQESMKAEIEQTGQQIAGVDNEIFYFASYEENLLVSIDEIEKIIRFITSKKWQGKKFTAEEVMTHIKRITIPEHYFYNDEYDGEIDIEIDTGSLYSINPNLLEFINEQYDNVFDKPIDETSRQIHAYAADGTLDYEQGLYDGDVIQLDRSRYADMVDKDKEYALEQARKRIG